MVTRGGFLADFIATILRLPAKSTSSIPTNVELRVEVEKNDTNAPNKEVWHRKFGGKPYPSSPRFILFPLSF